MSSPSARARLLLASVIVSATPDPSQAQYQGPVGDLVGVGVTRDGKAVILATPALPVEPSAWRFRSLNIEDVPGVTGGSLSSSATKVLLQTDRGPVLVVDLTKQSRHDQYHQYVAPVQPGGVVPDHGHRLPSQRFVSVRSGVARVVDDLGQELREYPAREALDAGIAPDGTVLYVRPDRVAVVCGESSAARAMCRPLPVTLPPGEGAVQVYAPSTLSNTPTADRFVLIVSDGDAARIITTSGLPASNGESARTTPPLEAGIRSALTIQQVNLPDAQLAHLAASLRRDVTGTPAARSTEVINWRFFYVEPAVELYMPVLEMGPQEQVFPSSFALLEDISRGKGLVTAEKLWERYRRLSIEERRQRCTMYYRTTSTAGSWLIEYWLYYPFDYGGVGSHLHDPEHVFVEVDKLGGAVRLVIGAGHGFLAGNNIYSADRRGAGAISLPIFVLVEQAKHASAPDIDRDGVFTPGIDENEYRERAKIWGLRDVIGTIKNELVSYDRTMSAVRHPSGYLAPAGVAVHFPHLTDLASRACCRLEYLPDPASTLKGCHDPTEVCARRAVTSHPDYRDVRNALKEWIFPPSFVRVTVGPGPRSSLHSIGIGYVFDLDRVPGLAALPGRAGIELFEWRQHVRGPDPLASMGTDPNLGPDPDACIDDCRRSRGVGYGIRFEQFTTNLFGVFASTKIYKPPCSEFWVTFGPMIEVPLFNKANVTLHAGLAFRAVASPRFEMRVSVGVWKRRTTEIGLRARKG